jgi:hypothetical protein
MTLLKSNPRSAGGGAGSGDDRVKNSNLTPSHLSQLLLKAALVLAVFWAAQPAALAQKKSLPVDGKVTESCPATDAKGNAVDRCYVVLAPSGFETRTDGTRKTLLKIPGSSVSPILTRDTTGEAASVLPGANPDGSVPPGGSVTFTVPKLVVGDGLGDVLDSGVLKYTVNDVNQSVQLVLKSPPAPAGLPSAAGQLTDIARGAISDLSIEAVAFDPVSNIFGIENIFGRIADLVGVGVKVLIPDLFSDTNRDGVVGDGDVLYSLVDLNVYLNSIPNIEMGDTFDIIDGLVAGLPGMMFSTTPFGFDESSGFDRGTPFSGAGETDATHEVAAVPEPSSISLVGLGLAVFLISRRRQAEVTR